MTTKLKMVVGATTTGQETYGMAPGYTKWCEFFGAGQIRIKIVHDMSPIRLLRLTSPPMRLYLGFDASEAYGLSLKLSIEGHHVCPEPS